MIHKDSELDVWGKQAREIAASMIRARLKERLHPDLIAEFEALGQSKGWYWPNSQTRHADRSPETEKES